MMMHVVIKEAQKAGENTLITVNCLDQLVLVVICVGLFYCLACIAKGGIITFSFYLIVFF